MNEAMRLNLKSSLVYYMIQKSFAFVNDKTINIAIKIMNALLWTGNANKHVEPKFFERFNWL